MGQKNSSYFMALPKDLIFALFLTCFSPADVVYTLAEIELIKPFSNYFFGNNPSQEFWKQLWKRDISTIIIPDNISWISYASVIKPYLSAIDHSDKTIRQCWISPQYQLWPDPSYFAKIGYDMLVRDILTRYPSESRYKTALDSAIDGGHKQLIRDLLEHKNQY